jgi:hypothetical protein
VSDASDARRAYAWLQGRAQTLHLRVHPEKSCVLYLGNGDDGFDFLGFHHRTARSRKYRKQYCHRWPSKRAMASIRAKIKAITAPRDRLKWPMHALSCKSSSRPYANGQLLPLGKLDAAVHPGRQLRPRAPRVA